MVFLDSDVIPWTRQCLVCVAASHAWQLVNKSQRVRRLLIGGLSGGVLLEFQLILSSAVILIAAARESPAGHRVSVIFDREHLNESLILKGSENAAANKVHGWSFDGIIGQYLRRGEITVGRKF